VSSGQLATKVVNLHKEPYDVYIGRAGKGQDGYFGNPFPLKGNQEIDRIYCIQLYSAYFLGRIDKDSEFKKRIEALKDKTLGCFCKPKMCHGDVIVDYLEDQ
jgi:hypothetical protein